MTTKKPSRPGGPVAGTPAEAAMIRAIEAGIAKARAAGQVIGEVTACRIAACLHRGLGGELERFAGTGQIRNVHAARLELFYAARGEPDLQPWRQALKEYLRHRGDDSPLDRGRPEPPRPITPPPAGMSCDPDAAVAYLRTDARDPVCRPGLALQMQHHACREYVRHRLHRRLAAVFADQPGSDGRGMRKLLAHLAVCHNDRVVVHRLDRLPPDSKPAKNVAALGARVLSVTESHTRTHANQTAMNTDLTQLTNRKETA